MKHFGNFIKRMWTLKAMPAFKESVLIYFMAYASTFAAGAVRYPVTGSTTRILAVSQPTGGYAVLIINAYAPNLSIALDMSPLPGGAQLKPFAVYRTSATEDFSSIPMPLTNTNGTFALELSGTSLTTWLFV